MNWDALGAVAELIGAVAIIISIVYLAVQVKQTRKQLQAQADDYISTRAFEAYNPVYEGDNARIFRVGLETPAALNEDEAFVFDLLMDRQRGAFSSVVTRQGNKSLHPETAKTMIASYKNLFLQTPGGQAWFEKRKQHMTKYELAALGINSDQ